MLVVQQTPNGNQIGMVELANNADPSFEFRALLGGGVLDQPSKTGFEVGVGSLGEWVKLPDIHYKLAHNRL